MEKETISEAFVNFVRGITRPVLTLFLTVHWATLYASIMQWGGDFNDIDSRYTGLVFFLILWWFGDRTFLKGKSLISIIKGGK